MWHRAPLHVGRDDKEEATKANIASGGLWGQAVGVGTSSGAVIIAAAMRPSAASAAADTPAKRLGGPLPAKESRRYSFSPGRSATPACDVTCKTSSGPAAKNNDTNQRD